MKKLIAGFSLCLIAVLFVLWYFFGQKHSLINPLGKGTPKEKPLLAYTFDNLKKTTFSPTAITLGRVIDENSNSVSQMFYFSVPQKPKSLQMLRVSGLANIPKQPGKYPVIVMFRGFVPDDMYKPGIGTQPSASVFVKNGFITLAPDFLGFGESDKGSSDSFENRFQTYTTALSLLSSLSTLNNGLQASYSGSITADMTKVGVWGHSNGGHIALATLAISGVSYPTVLWAPVSKSFPYSIIYYTDESDDQGKALRKTLAGFEEDYNTDLFSPSNYYQWIKAPVEINQGTADQEVPVWWSDQLVDIFKKNKVDVTYFTYPGADHNLEPSGWSDAVTRSMDFYPTHFAK